MNILSSLKRFHLLISHSWFHLSCFSSQGKGISFEVRTNCWLKNGFLGQLAGLSRMKSRIQIYRFVLSDNGERFRRFSAPFTWQVTINNRRAQFVWWPGRKPSTGAEVIKTESVEVSRWRRPTFIQLCRSVHHFLQNRYLHKAVC